MCCGHENKEEYDWSNEILREILIDRETVNAVGEKCVEAMKALQLNLKGKERYLAHYRRMGLTMCLDAMTTSPVESMNELTKHGPRGVDSNMNLSRSVVTMTQGHDARANEHMKKFIRDLGLINRASTAPTKNEIHRKCQYMLDQNFDSRNTMKRVHTGDEEWISWNFSQEAIEKECCVGPWPRLARYHHMRKLTVKRLDGQIFPWCTCQHYDR